MEGIIPAWGRILRGYRPALSVEITRECPLRCPGCYAYGDDHLGGEVTLRQVSDFKGQELVDRFFALIDAHRAAPRLDRGRRTARPLSRARRDPAAALENGHLHAGRHQRRPARPDGMGRRFRGSRSWCRSTDCSPNTTSGASRPPTIASSSTSKDTRSRCTARSRGSSRAATAISRSSCGSGPRIPIRGQIWISLYTPQVGEQSDERLTPADRERVVAALMHLRKSFPKLQHAGRVDRGVRASRRIIPRRLHFRADDDLRVRRLRAADLRRASSAATRTARTAAASRRRG